MERQAWQTKTPGENLVTHYTEETNQTRPE